MTIRPIHLFKRADGFRLLVGVNGQFWGLKLPEGAERDFIAAGVPVQPTCAVCGQALDFENAPHCCTELKR